MQLAANGADLLTNIPARKVTSLNGKWQYIIDIYETGFYDYRYKERAENDPEAYWNTDVPAHSLDRKEHGYNDTYTLNVPGDWNSQADKFLYYEGTVWYKKSFDYQKSSKSNKLYLHFGAVSYRADVYINGKKLGMHKGSFSPFNFEITDSLLKEKDNFLVVKVDNRRYANEIPTLNTDWWNYGGIIRDVSLVELPNTFISNYFVQLAKPNVATNLIRGWIDVKNAALDDEVTIEIPELKITKKLRLNSEGRAIINFNAPKLIKWSLTNPKLYQVNITTASDKISEKIGFRNIEVQGEKILLNGESVFLRGISVHAEIPEEGRRAHTQKDAEKLLGWARELGCNMVRLAHYPHDEKMTRLADSLGLLVWSEIPVYWTIDFKSEEVLSKAKTQLDEMIDRDKNRASIIIWSVGNETPVSEVRTRFMKSLLDEARKMDPTRLVSAALEVNYHSEENMRWIDDPLGEYVDIVSFNQYLGWYGGTPESCRTANWGTHYKKPLFISETGAEAVGGYHAKTNQLWSEEFQEWFYKEQVAMLKRMPSNFVGISPWLLADFRSPRRNNPVYQQGWNNKGLYDQQGRKKKAFYVLKAYYDELSKTK
ncbi:MAG: glycoside hydrolase family 2 TIM barrel-domain containing protein [Pedobacter sp.]|uniref:glycoside hydrolase family 2 protein n=1 Tax=Pedobacter sp. TaxID=1411316 RepID=UPI00280A1100|nr:glycoside hydrolase family 2 TIM barrel-domain containing protein [Pedobacter sp.]MDQ8004428.1 glycoside hydrolase family 2 TIM barrel-domain containing protein [Pedobacter sp.]